MPTKSELNHEPPMPKETVIDPADWRGPEIKDRSDWIYQLDETDIADLERALRSVEQKDLLSVTKDQFPLPHLGKKLEAVKRQLIDGLGFVLVRGLPIDRYSPKEVATLYWGIGRHLGKPVPTNETGHMISHVINLGHKIANPTERASYTKETLRYHNDMSDIVGLLCLQPAKAGGASTLASAVAIHNAIQAERPDLLRVLYQPWFIDRRGDPVPKGGQPWYEMPIFMWHEGRLLVWLQPQFATSSQRFPEVPRYTDAHWEALKLVETLADDPRFRLDMSFGPGDMQFLNNHVVLHSRTEYEDYPEPERRRHLLRLELVSPDVRTLTPWHAGYTPAGRFEFDLGSVTPNIVLNPG
ncbi:TauD/TfdA family dioxygenase [Bradyrhizobium yuanmingense]|uniref:TauD/TfdA family dioxygenase n=1 Tax=Bradyrhizobium yuanmingense TaxID=108015 RepID=UPI0023B930DD|nr:TauD/TfdA family dioxygenase [Bradyrhizobium yuanmingense]MDF0498652.1 TauD/TfdA family dioxygenase [Bradyrhizobium yuanmingense]